MLPCKGSWSPGTRQRRASIAACAICLTRSGRRSFCNAWFSVTPAAYPARGLASPAIPPPVRGRRTSSICPTPKGEDIVSGRRTPDGAGQLALLTPDVHRHLLEVCHLLEAEFRDVQEFEFTIQDGELFMLQSRNAKRTPWAALQIAVDQVHEGTLSRDDARHRLAGLDLQGIHRTHVLESDAAHAIALGEPVSMGIASGPIALDVDAAQRIAKQGRAPILIRRDTTTEDLAGMIVAAGLLTATGGRTSHAAVVAREMAMPCVVGAPGNRDRPIPTARHLGGREFAEGDQISIDGESGRVFADTVQIDDERPTANLATVAGWPATNGAA
jgi:pyruvate, orthophosphate dikinase